MDLTKEVPIRPKENDVREPADVREPDKEVGIFIESKRLTGEESAEIEYWRSEMRRRN